MSQLLDVTGMLTDGVLKYLTGVGSSLEELTVYKIVQPLKLPYEGDQACLPSTDDWLLEAQREQVIAKVRINGCLRNRALAMGPTASQEGNGVCCEQEWRA